MVGGDGTGRSGDWSHLIPGGRWSRRDFSSVWKRVSRTGRRYRGSTWTRRSAATLRKPSPPPTGSRSTWRRCGSWPLFRNGHTTFEDIWLWDTHGAPLGFDVRRFAAGWFVTASARPDVPPGAEVLAVDDETTEAFFASRRVHIAASSSREAAYRLFSRPYLFPAIFRLTLDGERATLIERGPTSLRRPAKPSLRWIAPDRVALLRIPCFDRSEYEAQAVAAVRGFAPDVRLVIDVRGNGGGNTPAMLIDALMTRPYRDWRATTPIQVALSRAQGGPRENRDLPASWHDPNPDAFSGPLAILVDGGTFSAAEDFVQPFKDNGRALLIGETTGGSSGQPCFKELGDGMRCWIGTKRRYFPDGAPFEGRGIEPDVAIPFEPSDFREGRDHALDEATRA